jgi:hypothetical protein
MFLRFTQRQRLIIYYSYNRRENNTFGRVFGLGERYTQLGAEGVASFIVQALLFSDASPHINQSKWRDRDRVALKSAPRQTVEWMREHSFHPKLVDSYLKVAEKWEQSERFREIASLPANSD